MHMHANWKDKRQIINMTKIQNEPDIRRAQSNSRRNIKYCRSQFGLFKTYNVSTAAALATMDVTYNQL
ncbi:MAG: hypothetical protein ACI9UT_000068 [Flavobacteriales bacterium]|jgi:hypothetical protein